MNTMELNNLHFIFIKWILCFIKQLKWHWWYHLYLCTRHHTTFVNWNTVSTEHTVEFWLEVNFSTLAIQFKSVPFAYFIFTTFLSWLRCDIKLRMYLCRHGYVAPVSYGNNILPFRSPKLYDNHVFSVDLSWGQ